MMKIQYLVIATLCALMPCLTMAQKKTNSGNNWWVTPPKSTDTVKRVVASAPTLQEARHIAINQLINEQPPQYEEGSYQRMLLEQGKMPIEQRAELVRLAEKSAYFKVARNYQNDSLCYVLCELSDKDYSAFCDSLYDALLTDANIQLAKAQQERERGELFDATRTYSKIICSLTPLLHKPLTTEQGDLLQLLKERYLHSMDSIEWSFERQRCLIVPDEDVPVELWAKASYKGHPVPGLPALFALSQDGNVTSRGEMTDAEGRLMAHIVKAPQQPDSKLMVRMNAQAIRELPEHIFSTDMAHYLAEQPRSHAMLPLEPFDPTPTYHLCLEEQDMAVLKDTLNQIMTRFGYVAAQDSASADLLLKMNTQQLADGEPLVGNKRTMQYFMASMSLSICDRRQARELSLAEKAGIRMFMPADIDHDVLRAQSLVQLLKGIRLQFVSRVKNLRYDKRKAMFAMD